MNAASTQQRPEITIIGAGWAGLAAAVTLAAQGYRINLIEAAPQAGGRARRISIGDIELDNGQHILLGAYQELLGLLKTLGLKEEDIFIRTRLNLKMHCMHGKGLHITVPKLGNPLHMLIALLAASGLSIAEKWKIIRCWTTMMQSGFKLDQDQTVTDYLDKQQQSERLVKLFWRPICVAALNTDIEKASMQAFLNVLNRSFADNRANSDMLLPRTGLDRVLPQPALDFIRQKGGKVSTGERLLKINTGPEGVTDIETTKGYHVVTHLILATPYQQTRKLLAPLGHHAAITTAMMTLEDEPITTLYMQFPRHIRLEGYMQGVCDGISQWFIDRRTCNQPGLIAAVISASGTHMQMDRETLTQAVIAEIEKIFPDWPQPSSTWLVREKRATFSCTPASGNIRPQPGNIGHNIWLAGDFVDTGLPATLEGAVASGLQCARQIITDTSIT